MKELMGEMINSVDPNQINTITSVLCKQGWSSLGAYGRVIMNGVV